MAGDVTTNQSNITVEQNAGRTGMNMDQSVTQIAKGTLSYALNAALENYDANSVNYQNEPGNEFCLNFPKGYVLIGEHFINEQGKHIFFLVNPSTGSSEIGYMDNNDCVYKTYINADCLNFNIDNPIHKAVHKITSCTTEIYWTDGINPRRFLDLTNIPYKIAPGTDVCDNQTIPEIDCNKINIQPNFNIPQLEVVRIETGGSLISGTYQFAIQYCDSVGGAFTSYYSVTNPTPIANTQITTPNFNYEVGKSIVLNIKNIDVTGYYEYFNIAVIKTVNSISSVELVGTYFIDRSEKEITYTGQNQTQIRLTLDDIFEKFPTYEIAQDLTAAQDVLIWDNLTSVDRINYQQIANRITLLWETWRIPSSEDYSNEENATNLRGYLRDEVYAFEIVFLLRNGKQTDGFHIPGRIRNANDSLPDISEFSSDFIGAPSYYQGGVGYSPYWKIYNTASVIGDSEGKSYATDYKGPWEYGQFAYWESTELYPCNENVWGELANQPIRHHKFPDVRVSPIFENPTITYSSTGRILPVMMDDAVFPIGVRVNTSDIVQIINQSNLSQDQKDSIVGYKIVRGDRGTNKSIVAKGMLRNVGKYTREETEYYYPNYPYNDIKADPFIQKDSNAFYEGCDTYRVEATSDGEIEYTNCITGDVTTEKIFAGVFLEICSLSMPRLLGTATAAYIGLANYTIYEIVNRNFGQGGHYDFIDPRSPDTASRLWIAAYGTPGNFPYSEYRCPTFIPFKDKACNIRSIVKPFRIDGADMIVRETGLSTSSKICNSSITNPLEGFDEDAKYRYVFNSPETSFGQPFLGNILRLESVMFGGGRAHFVEVRDNANYKLLTKEAQEDALQAAVNVGSITGTGTNFNASAMFAAYQAYLTIYVNGITRKNYAKSFNSIASYNYAFNIDNGIGIKQRPLDLKSYLIPGVQSVGETNNIPVNNWQRESSVYLRTDVNKPPLPYAEDTPSLIFGGAKSISDDSRFVASDKPDGCQTPEKQQEITVVSYYGSMKNSFVNQWGQIYSYDTIDTGFQRQIIFSTNTTPPAQSNTVFGGDTFISRFAYKTKLPFFIDNRVGAPDDSDIFYDEIGNIAYPRYWHSARSILSNGTNIPTNPSILPNFISYKAHNFDCPNNQQPKDSNPNRTYYNGYFYLFAYGIPNFYCETSYNTDLRQAFNNKEGDFWPHVSTSIPDDWLQESFVTIAQDNTYYYNTTFSKQNKENYFSHLPVDWEESLCNTYFPFRAIYSDVQSTYSNDATNNWLIYRPVSFYDFPQNYGNLTSLDGIQNKSILARFENKTLLYNSLLTIDTSNPKAAYIGNDKLFAGSPPIDFAETDLGYVGSQNKMLLKIPQGQITIDAKRGQVFLLAGDGVKDLSAFGSGMNRFFTDHLAFEILRYFPDVNTDNHFNGVGIHGVYDSKYDRVIISKLDYIPLSKDIKYDATANDFYIEEDLGGNIISSVVSLTDSEYFCNKSWTLSFNMNTNSWVSFHSYIPNFYIAENNFFYSGLNESCDLEAIAAEEIPYTTSTTTSSSTSTTTSTSTTVNPYDCELVAGPIQLYNCTIVAGAALRPATTSTTTSSTTSTTTTICPTCSTYYVINNTNGESIINWTGCLGTTQTITFAPFQAIHLCSCSEPAPVPGFLIELTVSGDCISCFCYTFTNTTTTAQTINWADCDGFSLNATVEAGRQYCVCAIEGSCFAPTGVTIVGGTAPCSLNNECGIPLIPASVTETLIADCPDRIYEFAVPELPIGAASVSWVVAPGMFVISQTELTITVSAPYDGTVGAILVYGVNDCGPGGSFSYSFSIPSCPTTTTTSTTQSPDCYCWTAVSDEAYTLFWTNCSGFAESHTMTEQLYQFCALEGTPVTHSLGTLPISITGGLDLCIANACPSTTTTTTTIIVDLCAPLFTNLTDVFSYDVTTNVSRTLIVPGYAQVGNTVNNLAHTANKLWTIANDVNTGIPVIYEWDITLSPFTAVLNRTINLPVGFTNAPGLVAVSDTVLVAIDTSRIPSKVVTLDVTGSTAAMTDLFDFPADRYLVCDFILTTTNKLILNTTDLLDIPNYYICQIDYSTGNLELDLVIQSSVGQSLSGIYEESSIVYLVSNALSGYVYRIDTTVPYNLTLAQTSGLIFTSSSQVLSCNTEQFITTTTTSSTSTSTTTTTSSTSTTTTTTTINYTKCAECGPTLNDVTNNAIGVLSVGNMTTSLDVDCVLGNYAIDWYLDSISNPIQFTSGNATNTDPIVQQFHPFTGNNALPSVGGLWIPVIRYAFLGGIKYTPTPTPGALLATDLAQCLIPVTVENPNCDNGNNTETSFSQYSHKFSYRNTKQTAAFANKTLSFILNSDGSIQYFPWYFAGYTVSDRITFTYVSPINNTAVVLQDFAIGNNVGANNFNLVPKRVVDSAYKGFINLTGITHALGDYILINIQSNFIQAQTTNTDWDLYFKCLPTFDPTWRVAEIDLCASTLTYNSGTCEYKANYSFINYDDNTTSDIAKYLAVRTAFKVAPVPSTGSPNAITSISFGVDSCTYQGVNSFQYNLTCIYSAGSITVTKAAGANYSVVYTQQSDYDKFKTDYTNAYNFLNNGSYVNDPSNINYYRFLQFNFLRYANDNCGDTLVANRVTIIHFATLVFFNDLTKTVSFTATTVDVAQFYATLGPCPGNGNTACSTLSLADGCNSSASASTFVLTTLTDTVYSVFAARYEKTFVNDSSADSAMSYTYYEPFYPTLILPAANNWNLYTQNANVRKSIYYDFYNIVTITDLLSPSDNFKIESILSASGVASSANKHLIYEQVGGTIFLPDTCVSTTTTQNPFAQCLNVNPNFDTNLDGWEVELWAWSPNYGGTAVMIGSDGFNYIRQNILTVGQTYRITFDYYFSGNGNNGNTFVIETFAGTTGSGQLLNTNGVHFADVTLTCTGTSYFAIGASSNLGVADPTVLFVDNVCVVEVAPPDPITIKIQTGIDTNVIYTFTNSYPPTSNFEMYVDWGDGSPLETYSGDVGYVITHTYTGINPFYTATFTFDDRTKPDILDISLSTNVVEVNNLGYLPSLKLFNGLSNTQLSNVDTSTSYNLRGFYTDSSQITSVDFTNNPLMDTIILNNSTISTIDITSLVYLVELQLDGISSLSSISSFAGIPIERLTMLGSNLSSADVNNILFEIDVNNTPISLLGSYIFLQLQSPPAPPTVGPPDGITAKNNLLTKGWTVGTD